MTQTTIKKDTLAEIHFLLGYALEKQNQNDEVIENYKLATKKNDQHAEAHFRLGLNLYKDNQELNAEEIKNELEKAITLECDDQANAHYYLGKVLVAEKDYYEATTNLIKARNLFRYHDKDEKVNETNLALKPCAEYWYKEGENYERNKDYKNAFNWYENVTIIYPEHAESYYKMGNCRDEQEEYEEAIEDISKAIELNPNYADAYWLRGWIYLHRQRVRNYQKAIEDFRQAIEIVQKPKYSLDLAKAILKQGLVEYGRVNIEKVIKNWQQSIELVSPLVEYYNDQAKKLLAEVKLAINVANYAQGNRLQDLIKQTKQILQEYKHLGDVDFLKYNLWWGDRLLADARNLLAEVSPKDADYYYKMGNHYLQRGQYDQAIECYQNSTVIQPYHVAAYCQMGHAFYEKNDVKKAV
ncbi:tetratricopeptide repeat protein [Moorena sp. SIO3I6]|uniref:tetratricopeptide repeat protein n=1 Tax=Moorena sp. SIO3I6 TaxID=2607831 RepID=UPI0013FC9C66|nr:tetratricopeptide repeat protein [Moorena sp. SIO3I6]NEP26990.1 tetratricopeptide repeat protein [Moorena sp. SIO3I6]